ncbi:DUF4271 domain-containing protein [Marivirga arenosa]|uniref:DUF4271 domain-containing protein n=1 Tax=Marivirga arenosa TaxID=3059076 RepID=A0AA52EZW9_9BACT|nr:DUF4271 domain-containing protein [Marivirga sp. BKB1-2]WNB17828.1 DUF4271 domain-containing protein [Marivirga sp. BKB1-2]
MYRIILYILPLLFFSCQSEDREAEIELTKSSNQLEIIYQADTLSNLSQWDSDSLRQIKIKTIENKKLYLEAVADAPLYLFKDAKLIYGANTGELRFEIDKAEKGNYYLGIDDKAQEFSFKTYFLQHKKENALFTGLINFNRETKWISNNVLIIILIITALAMVVIKLNYDKRLFQVLSFNKVFTTRLNEGDQSRVRITDQDNLIFGGLYVFLISSLVYFLSFYSPYEISLISNKGLPEFFNIILWVAIGLISKVVLVTLFSNLFGNSKISAFYIKEMLNINLFFIIIIFFITALIFLYLGFIPNFWFNTALFGLLFFYLLRLILLYFKILKLSGFSNLYLFSYFCTTEIFPFLIGLKYFVR